jgi:DinB superfamily
MMTETTYQSLLSDTATRLTKVRERIQRVAGTLRPDQLLWLPSKEGWSIGQAIEHLLIADSLYHDRIGEAIGRGQREERLNRGGSWRPTISGRFLHGVVRTDNTRRFRAPQAFEPSARPRPSVVTSYLSLLVQLEELLGEAHELDLNRLRFGSPALALFRLNLGDAFLLIVTHAERHAGQMERIRAAAGFPE